MRTLIKVKRNETPTVESFVEQYPPHLDILELLTGPMVQFENTGINITAGYLHINFIVFFHPFVVIKTNTA